MTELTSQLDLHEPGDQIEVTVIRYANASQVTQSNAYPYFGGSQSGSSATTGQVTVSGGFDEITILVTLEELQ